MYSGVSEPESAQRIGSNGVCLFSKSGRKGKGEPKRLATFFFLSFLANIKCSMAHFDAFFENSVASCPGFALMLYSLLLALCLSRPSAMKTETAWIVPLPRRNAYPAETT